ncbi:MAG: hypothetical protein IID31_01915 [Planctomycetes bacterium]|nr:hypothetical protein [Planctomycetota bacterium]
MFANRIQTLMSCSVVAVTVAVAPAAARNAPCSACDTTQLAKSLHDGPVNANCPISKRPVDPEAATLQYNGHTIGFCCPNCESKFKAWDEQKKDDFVRVSMMHLTHPAGEEHAGHDMAVNPTERTGDLYLLNTCPISGEELGEMGDAIVKVYDGREVRFCCKGCIEDFEADPAAHWKTVNEQIIKRQMPYYPLDTCIISEESLDDEEMGGPINFVYQNRLIRFCCKGCKSDFLADSKTFLKKLDEAAIAKQREHYPLETCFISGEALESMDEPIDKVYGNRLVRFCCKGCISRFEKDPTAHIATLDMAWREIRGDDDGPNEHDDHGEKEHDHGGHSHGGG